jgi:hypothetical protein
MDQIPIGVIDPRAGRSREQMFHITLFPNYENEPRAGRSLEQKNKSLGKLVLTKYNLK